METKHKHMLNELIEYLNRRKIQVNLAQEYLEAAPLVISNVDYVEAKVIIKSLLDDEAKLVELKIQTYYAMLIKHFKEDATKLNNN